MLEIRKVQFILLFTDVRSQKLRGSKKLWFKYLFKIPLSTQLKNSSVKLLNLRNIVTWAKALNPKCLKLSQVLASAHPRTSTKRNKQKLITFIQLDFSRMLFFKLVWCIFLQFFLDLKCEQKKTNCFKSLLCQIFCFCNLQDNGNLTLYMGNTITF